MVEDFRELKLGKSFTNESDSSFHTLRYDFKPASIDEHGIGTIKIENGNRVTAQLPNVENAGKKHTTFCGSRKPSQKECILIIDHDTGEITLEKISSSIQLKKIRLANNLPKNVGGQTMNISKMTSTALPINETPLKKSVESCSNIQFTPTLTPKKPMSPVARKSVLTAKKPANLVKGAHSSSPKRVHSLSLSDSEDNVDFKDNDVTRHVISASVNKSKQGPPLQATLVMTPTPLSEKEDGEMDDDENEPLTNEPTLPGGANFSLPLTPSVPPHSPSHALNLTVSSSSSSPSSGSSSSPSSSGGSSSRDSSPSSRDSPPRTPKKMAPPTTKYGSSTTGQQVKQQQHNGHRTSVDLNEDLKLSESDSRSDDSD